MSKMRFRPGLRPGHRWGRSRRSPRPSSRLARGHPSPDLTPLAFSACPPLPPLFSLPSAAPDPVTRLKNAELFRWQWQHGDWRSWMDWSRFVGHRARPPSAFWRILGLNLHFFEYLMQLTDTLSHNIISHQRDTDEPITKAVSKYRIQTLSSLTEQVVLCP